MIKIKSSLQAAIFLDHSNIVTPVIKQKKYQEYVIDYKQLKEKMALNYSPEVAYAFMGVSNPLKPKKGNFIKYLDEDAKFIPMLIPVAVKPDGRLKQEQVDGFMREYINSRTEDFDVFIIGSGDVHFLILIMMLLSMYKIVIIWSWKDSLSSSLRKTVGSDYIYYIDDIWEDIKKRKVAY